MGSCGQWWSVVMSDGRHWWRQWAMECADDSVSGTAVSIDLRLLAFSYATFSSTCFALHSAPTNPYNSAWIQFRPRCEVRL